ncbi:MAG: hypothetical protein JNM79_08465 [Burkholderiales bacterium]|nr:hypothetical protein [Burkholderiales bacterium]
MTDRGHVRRLRLRGLDGESAQRFGDRLSRSAGHHGPRISIVSPLGVLTGPSVPLSLLGSTSANLVHGTQIGCAP